MSLAFVTSDALDPRAQLQSAYDQVIRTARTLSESAGLIAQFPEENMKFQPVYNNMLSLRTTWINSYKALMDVENRIPAADWNSKAISLSKAGYELVNLVHESFEGIKETDWDFVFLNVAYKVTNAVTAIPRYSVTELLSATKEAVTIGIQETGEVARTLAGETKSVLEKLGLSPTKLLLVVAGVGGAYLFLPKLLAGKK